MVRIGAGLKEARENQDISLLQVEEATKINRRYLEALEADEFQELPGSVYAVGFLKNYARFLGFSPDEISLMVDRMKENMGVDVTKPIIKTNNSGKTNNDGKIKDNGNFVDYGNGKNGKRRKNLPGRSFIRWSDWKLLLGGALIVGAIFAIVSVYQAMETKKILDPTDPAAVSAGSEESQPGESTVANNPTVEDLNANPAAAPENNQSSAAPVNLKLVVQKDECWIRIVADSKEVLNEILKAGDSREFNAEESIFVHLGNAGTVEAFQNGQSIGYLGKWGQTVKKEFRQ